MTSKTCSVSDCTNGGKLRGGLCGACYQRSKGNPGKDPVGRPRSAKPPADGQCTIVENGTKCSNRHVARGMCNMHHLRAKKYGAPLTTLTRPKRTLIEDLRAAAYTDTDDCLFLAGYASRPSVPFNGKTMFASRAVWIIRHGDPGTAHVLHTCNGGSGAHGCINIRHLGLGDAARNTHDAVESGTHRLPHHQGEAVAAAVLSERQVRTIRERWKAGGVTQKDLAAEYGVSRALLSMLVNGKRWTHIV